MVEIYNETVQDLLTTDARTLDLQMVGNIVKIPNITEMEVRYNIFVYVKQGHFSHTLVNISVKKCRFF